MIASSARAATTIDAVVLAALPEEMQPLRARLGNVRALAGDERIALGRWAGRDVALAIPGDGERNARMGAAAAFGEVINDARTC